MTRRSEWLAKQELFQRYKFDIKSHIDKVFQKEISNIKTLCLEIEKVHNRKYLTLAIRNWIKFLEEEELTNTEIINRLKSRIKIKDRSNIDSYVPNTDEIEDFLTLSYYKHQNTSKNQRFFSILI